MESGFGPLGLLFVDFIKELKREAVFFGVALPFESDVGWGEINFLVADVLKLDLQKHSVFSLSPLDKRMPMNKLIVFTAFVCVEWI